MTTLANIATILTAFIPHAIFATGAVLAAYGAERAGLLRELFGRLS